RQLKTTTLNKCTCCHYNGMLIARHVPWLRGNMCINSCCLLNTLHEANEMVGLSKTHSLNQISSLFIPFWLCFKAKLLKYSSSQHTALYSLRNNMWCKK